MSSPVDLAGFLAGYLAEVEEYLAVATAQLLVIDAGLRRGEPCGRAVRELFRALHTIKGLSAMVGVEPVVAVAHRMETVLRAGDRAGGRLALPAVDVLLQGVRAIERCSQALAADKPVPAPAQALLDALDALDALDVPPTSEGAPAPPASEGTRPPEARARPAGPATLALAPELAARLAPFEFDQLVQGVAAGRRAVRVDFAPSPARAAEGLTINTVRERVGKLAEVVKVVPLAVPRSEAAPGSLAFALLVLTTHEDAELAAAAGVNVATLQPLTRGAAPAEVPPAEAPPVPEALDVNLPDLEPHRRSVVRVDVARLDAAMERLSALIVTRSRLAREVAGLTASGVNTRALVQIMAENTRQLRDLRAAILRVRMVPVAEVLERVPLIVRGLRRATGKAVRLEIDAGQAELDKAVAERIFPAVVHLVRNAVDHAIEAPEERRRRGKPEEGVLRIACFARSNAQLELTVADDGRGVDRAAVARRADAEVPATDAALLRLLCQPGLSTQAAATTTSGRGMGMDIVRRVAVDELGGELLMTTTEGVGTTFTLRVPLTISIVDAFAFECAAQRFVVPLAMIEEIVNVDPTLVVHSPANARRRLGDSGGVGMIERRGEAVPLVRLGALFGIGAAGDGGRKALVVRRDGEPMAFAVDRLLGQQEVVVRPLEDPMVRVPGVAGATDLGDGRPTLVIDLVALGATLTTAGANDGRRPAD